MLFLGGSIASHFAWYFNNLPCPFTDITFDIYFMLGESAAYDIATLPCVAGQP